MRKFHVFYSFFQCNKLGSHLIKLFCECFSLLNSVFKFCHFTVRGKMRLVMKIRNMCRQCTSSRPACCSAYTQSDSFSCQLSLLNSIQQWKCHTTKFAKLYSLYCHNANQGENPIIQWRYLPIVLHVVWTCIIIFCRLPWFKSSTMFGFGWNQVINQVKSSTV